jgi:hypothetical protein
MESCVVSRKAVLTAVIGGLIILNLFTFIAAYPETSKIDSGCCAVQPLAKDFSAYYTSAWRLFRNPSQVYTRGFVDDGEFHVLPQPEAYKYLPSFLVLVSPLLTLDYQQALIVFDILQFLLLPVIGLMLCLLLREKGLLLNFAVAVVVLFQPFPAPNGGLSVTYFWQWGEGQAKVLETFLLMLAFYLGRVQKPRLSGVVLGLAAFDPRFALIAFPLFLTYNRRRMRSSVGAALGTLVISNIMLLYPGMGSGFLAVFFGSGLSTPVYPYTYIPLPTVLSLSVVNGKELAATMAQLAEELKRGVHELVSGGSLSTVVVGLFSPRSRHLSRSPSIGRRHVSQSWVCRKSKPSFGAK